MDENKKIKKLTENGKQSAEKVSGGAGNELAEGISIKSPPPNECFLKRERCVGCGKEVFDLMDGKYCGECYFLDKYNHSFVCGTKNNNSLNSLNGNLSGSDLSQVSGGTDISTRGFNHDRLSHKPNYHNCQKCGKEFSFIEHEAVRCNGAPPFCAKCMAKQRLNQK